MDSTWVFNFDCNNPPNKTPQYYDSIIIPRIFYNAVINRNVDEVNQIIKYNSKISNAVVTFYINTLQYSFYTKKSAKYGAPVRIAWPTETNVQITKESTNPLTNSQINQLNLYDISSENEIPKIPEPTKITIQVPNSIIMNFNDQVQLYKYITIQAWNNTNFGFLVNTINHYLTNLRTALTFINNKYPANSYYKYGINVSNNPEMKRYISLFMQNLISPTFIPQNKIK